MRQKKILANKKEKKKIFQSTEQFIRKIEVSRMSFKQQSKSQQQTPVYDYLDEYDNYYLDNEKHIQVGNGGKQRNKRESFLNSNKFDPSGNVRKIVSNMQNFEHKRRKSSSS